MRLPENLSFFFSYFSKKFEIFSRSAGRVAVFFPAKRRREKIAAFDFTAFAKNAKITPLDGSFSRRFFLVYLFRPFYRDLSAAFRR